MKRNDIKRTESRLSERSVGYSIVYTDEVGSTNDMALEYVTAHPEADRIVFAAGKQTEGKGRRGRKWDTDEAEAMTFSVLVRPGVPAECFPPLTLIMGLAASEAVERICGIKTGIKWPNDVIVRGKKICGILTETDPSMTCAVIGTGINVSQKEWPDELKSKAISLAEAGCNDPDEAILLADILERFDGYLKVYEKTGDLSGLKTSYEAKLIRPEAGIIVKDPKGDYTALIKGIDNNGALVTESPDGGGKTVITAGEISIRSTEGYI